jgi:hypothetical protein
LKVEKLYRGTQYKASFTNSGFVRMSSAIYNFYHLLLYMAEANRTIIAMAQIFNTTSQKNGQWTLVDSERDREEE